MSKTLRRSWARSTNRSSRCRHVACGLLTALAMLLTTQAAARQETSGGSWLDRPLTSWNQAGQLPAAASAGDEDREALRARCGIAPSERPAHRALEESGWTPYHHLDRELARGDVEVLAGMTAADAACQPTHFQIFIFVQGRFAGTLSPQPMTTGRDGAAGAVRIIEADTIRGEFARFQGGDPSCCPSSRMTVRYRIERTGGRAVLVPVDVRTTRGYAG